KLKELDAAENNLSSLNIKNCRELRIFSCRDNWIKKINLENKNFLEFLAISNNQFPPMDVKTLSHLTNLETLIIGLHLPGDISKEERQIRGQMKGNYNKFYGSLEAFKDMNE